MDRGLTSRCTTCAGGCATDSDACPPEAIAKEEASEEVYNRSNLLGVEKWTTDAEKCFGFWATQMTDCSICVRVCPYNRDYPAWINRLRVRLMGSLLRGLMLRLDRWLGGGERRPPRWWWSRSEN